MINNKVIIDGVDVQDCCFYNKCFQEDDYEIQNFCESHYKTCEGIANCYYKQLQRKTQECEKLKEEITQIKKDLRKRFSIKNVPDDDIIITCPKKQTCYEHLHAREAMTAYRQADKKLKICKSALEEIEEIANKCEYPCKITEYPCDIGEIKDIITKAKEQK